jgi:hypothetical protein
MQLLKTQAFRRRTMGLIKGQQITMALGQPGPKTVNSLQI